MIISLPSGNLLQFAIEHGPVEIVDLPSSKMVDLSSSLCKRLPEGRLFQGKMYRNPPRLMLKTMVSCSFPLKPIPDALRMEAFCQHVGNFGVNVGKYLIDSPSDGAYDIWVSNSKTPHLVAHPTY